MFVDDLFDKKSLTEAQGGGSPWHSEPEQQQMDADRRGRLGRERNAGLDEPDDAVSGSVPTGNGVYEYTVPAGQESTAQELGLQQHRGHWFSRVPIQRANFQFGQPQFREIPSQGVAEGSSTNAEVTKRAKAAAQKAGKTFDTDVEYRLWYAITTQANAATRKADKKQGMAEGAEQRWRVTVGNKSGTLSHTKTFTGTKEQAIKQAVKRFATTRNPVVTAELVKQGVAEGSKTPTDWMGVPTKLAKNDKKPIKRPSGYDKYIKQGAKHGFQDDPTNPLRKKVKEQGVAEGSEGSEDLASLRAKANEISNRIDAIVKDGGRVGFNDPLSRQLKAIRSKIQQAKKQGVAEGSKEKTPGVALSKAYKKDFDDKKPGHTKPDTALTGAYSKTGKPGGELKKKGVAEGIADLKNIDPGELAGSTLGGIAGYMAGDAVGGPMVGFGAAGVGSAVGGALAKEGMLDNPGQEDSPVAQAIIRRILMQRTDLLAKHGPEKVGQAVDEVADFVGDVDEIGSSDVSGWVRHVEQMLGNMEQDMAEGNMLSNIKAPAAPSSPALAAPRAPAVAETLRQIDRMLESVNSKKSAEIVRAYADQQFAKLGLHNTPECKQIMAHVVHESAVRRRAYAQRMAK